MKRNIQPKEVYAFAYVTSFFFTVSGDWQTTSATSLEELKLYFINFFKEYVIEEILIEETVNFNCSLSITIHGFHPMDGVSESWQYYLKKVSLCEKV